jgi:hypothetical protein
MKILTLILTIIFISKSVISKDNLKLNHEFGINLLGLYEYEEPTFMNLKAGVTADDDKYSNIGFVYNAKKPFLLKDYLTELEIDTGLQILTQSYWSNSTGTISDKDLDIFNIRALYGPKVSDRLMIKSGIGYRYLYDYGENITSTTGALAYDRKQEFYYIPLIAELEGLGGLIKLEYDYIFIGRQNSYLGYVAGNEDLEFKNDNGFMYKASYKRNFKDFNFEPYFEFISVEESNIVSSSKEPSNTTHEIGMKITKAIYNVNNNNNFKKIFDDDSYYVGIQLLLSEVESGFHSTTGSAKIEEDGQGFSLLAGMKVFDKQILNKSLQVDLISAYNQFSKSVVKCNSGDSFITDGRYRSGLYSAGTRLTCSADNNDVVIESYSFSYGVKADLNILERLSLNGTLGMHKWDQSENDFIANNSATALTNYADTDLFGGIGIKYNHKDTFNVELGYMEHKMMYDAKSYTLSASYKF